METRSLALQPADGNAVLGWRGERGFSRLWEARLTKSGKEDPGPSGGTGSPFGGRFHLLPCTLRAPPPATRGGRSCGFSADVAHMQTPSLCARVACVRLRVRGGERLKRVHGGFRELLLLLLGPVRGISHTGKEQNLQLFPRKGGESA